MTKDRRSNDGSGLEIEGSTAGASGDGDLAQKALALADLISDFVFGGLNAYGQPSNANTLLLDAVTLLREIGESTNVRSAQN